MANDRVAIFIDGAYLDQRVVTKMNLAEYE